MSEPVMNALKASAAVFLLAFAGSITAAPDQSFEQWIATDQGQHASLNQMKQRCEEVLNASQHLKCSVSVFARMFEEKAANQIPDYYLAVRRKHVRAIASSPELSLLFSMFDQQSVAILMAAEDFSVSRTRRREVLAIHPYASDSHPVDEVLPFIDVTAANGVSARFILDTGSPQTRVNHDTAKRMGITLLPDSHYRYSTFYGEHGLSAGLGILPVLNVGTSTFRNVLVFVSDRENLLGLDLINKLGRLKITRKTLEINPLSAERCDARVVYARQDLNQRLLIAARLDRRATLAIIDTGNVDYLTSASPGDQVNVVSAMTPGNSSIYPTGKQSYQTFKGVLDVPGNSRVVTYKFYPDFTIPPSLLSGQSIPSILLGWRAFNDFELSLDAEAGQSCFNGIQGKGP
jgi:hypothetical protein